MRNKYRAIKTEVDGILFHSRKESHRYLQLKMLLKQGYIKDLECQPCYEIVVNHIKVCKVILDFRYVSTATNKEIIEDVKGMDTALSRIKRKLLKALYNIEVILI